MRPTIGFLGSGTPAVQGQWVAAFVQRLRELGWIEGRNLTIEYRWAEGSADRAVGFLIFVDWDADKLVLQDAPELPALVVTIARPDFIDARGFFSDGATPKEIRFTSHLGSPGPEDWKTHIVTTRPGDLNRMTAATKTRTSGVKSLTYSNLDLICRVEHVSQ
jgi:hypothetical protein